MTARIYRPVKSATQSGWARTKYWLLDYGPEKPREVEPLMGWTSSSDMKSQLRLSFATKEEAIAYAERNGIAYRVEEPKPMQPRIMQYADNFKPNRTQQWTH
jgi:ETC complex I subunit conserved region